MDENEANRSPHEVEHDYTHDHHQDPIDSCRNPDTSQIQKSETSSEEKDPKRVWNHRKKVVSGDTRENHAQNRDQQIIHEHAPTRHESQVFMKAPPHIGVGRPGSRIAVCHSSVTYRRNNHGYHSNHDCRDCMAAGNIVGMAEQWERRHWLDQDDSIDDKIA